jgi:hypothetical protein
MAASRSAYDLAKIEFLIRMAVEEAQNRSAVSAEQGRREQVRFVGCTHIRYNCTT